MVFAVALFCFTGLYFTALTATTIACAGAKVIYPRSYCEVTLINKKGHATGGSMTFLPSYLSLSNWFEMDLILGHPFTLTHVDESAGEFALLQAICQTNKNSTRLSAKCAA